MTTEHQRIARIRALLARPSAAHVQVGIGDDCAVLAQAAGPRVWTIDAAVEGVHFRRDRMALADIGFRAFMAAASDLAAMGAKATAALSALILPATLSDDELEALISGIARASDACACPVVGGNLARGNELSLTTTVLGEPHTRVLLRSGARAGDGLFVTGPLGGAALGMHALFADRREPDFEPYLRAFLAPRARLDLSQDLGCLASSAIDVSDGLLQDATHLAEASQLTANIEIARVPTLPLYESLAASLHLDALHTMVAGGEDYEVLFTAPVDADVNAWATRIGMISEGPGEARLLDATGANINVQVGGFDHFR